MEEKAILMSLDDIYVWAVTSPKTIIYIQEAATGECRPVTEDEQNHPLFVVQRAAEGEIRCWTAMPDEEQKERII